MNIPIIVKPYKQNSQSNIMLRTIYQHCWTPVHAHPQQLFPECPKVAKQHFEHMLQIYIIYTLHQAVGLCHTHAVRLNLYVIARCISNDGSMLRCHQQFSLFVKHTSTCFQCGRQWNLSVFSIANVLPHYIVSYVVI